MDWVYITVKSFYTQDKNDEIFYRKVSLLGFWNFSVCAFVCRIAFVENRNVHNRESNLRPQNCEKVSEAHLSLWGHTSESSSSYSSIGVVRQNRLNKFFSLFRLFAMSALSAATGISCAFQYFKFLLQCFTSISHWVCLTTMMVI